MLTCISVIPFSIKISTHKSKQLFCVFLNLCGRNYNMYSFINCQVQYFVYQELFMLMYVTNSSVLLQHVTTNHNVFIYSNVNGIKQIFFLFHKILPLNFLCMSPNIYKNSFRIYTQKQSFYIKENIPLTDLNDLQSLQQYMNHLSLYSLKCFVLLRTPLSFVFCIFITILYTNNEFSFFQFF